MRTLKRRKGHVGREEADRGEIPKCKSRMISLRLAELGRLPRLAIGSAFLFGFRGSTVAMRSYRYPAVDPFTLSGIIMLHVCLNQTQ
jgi:hypothetical protein